MRYETMEEQVRWLGEPPREKMMERGVDALTDAELLALLLGTGTFRDGKKISVLQLAMDLLKEFEGIGGLSRVSLVDLLNYRGIGQAKATKIAAAFEIARRKGLQECWVPIIRSPEQAAAYLIHKLGHLPQEVFYVIYLNQGGRILGEETISTGGVNFTAVDPRLVFRGAVSRLASSVLVAHNHPSGRIYPSQMDKRVTQKLVQGAKSLSLEIMDHLIVSGDDYFSFRNEGLMREMMLHEGSSSGA